MYHYLIVFVFVFALLFCIFRTSNKKISKNFYTTEETFPFLPGLTNGKVEDMIADVERISEKKWKDWPEYKLSKPGNWKVLPFMAFGKWHATNVKECPHIHKLLKKIPNMVNAALSRLAPGVKLAYHYGWADLSNNVLRCHFGLIVPGPAYVFCCESKNKPESVKQEVGKWIIFDDSRFHSADNQGDSDRIVLIVDIKRPKNVKTGKSEVQYSKEVTNFIAEFNKG